MNIDIVSPILPTNYFVYSSHFTLLCIYNDTCF